MAGSGSLFMACLGAFLWTVLWTYYMSHLTSRIKGVVA